LSEVPVHVLGGTISLAWISGARVVREQRQTFVIRHHHLISIIVAVARTSLLELSGIAEGGVPTARLTDVLLYVRRNDCFYY